MQEIFAALGRMMHQVDPALAFRMVLWDGQVLEFGEGSPAFVMTITTQEAARHCVACGTLGFGECYMDGGLTVEGDLQQALKLALNVDLEGGKITAWQKLRVSLLALGHRCTLSRARRNISYHYDRGNRFYQLYLDPTMTYSCAYWRDGCDDLQEAQEAKYEHICRKLLLEPGQRLLDIGCGWGGMLIYAAQRHGIQGVGVTLSKGQLEYARQRVAALGLADRVEIRYQDYRQLGETFDKIVSIGMFEHVGRRYIPRFMGKVAGLLKDKGMGLLHTIARLTPGKVNAWTERYIFPGGYLPVLSEMAGPMEKNQLSILDVENLRLHYALTLDRWAENFERNLDEIKKLVDENFIRRWRLFFHGSAASFRYSDICLYQVLFSRGHNNELPIVRDHCYL